MKILKRPLLALIATVFFCISALPQSPSPSGLIRPVPPEGKGVVVLKAAPSDGPAVAEQQLGLVSAPARRLRRDGVLRESSLDASNVELGAPFVRRLREARSAQGQ